MASLEPQATGEQLVADTPVNYQMGELLKRQRGVHHPNARRLIFQKRWFILNGAALVYYKNEAASRKRNQAPRGTFPVREIKIVETVSLKTIGVDFCFQVGNDVEVLYLAAKSLEEMDKWMKEFKKAAKDSNNRMMAKYHTGVYRRKAWSCCGGNKEKSEGCTQVDSSERCQSETNGQQVEGDNYVQLRRSNSEGFHPQPLLMNHPSSAEVPSSPINDLSLSQPDLPLLPARNLQLSNMIIPSSRIRVEKALGEASFGRFGVVYKAYLRFEGTQSQEMTVALKTPRGPEALQELWKEGLKMMKVLAHPHVMRLIGICKDGPTPGIIMPFMENGSLLSYVKKEKDLVVPTDAKMEEAKVKQTSDKLMDMCLQIAEGMQYLAANHLVHRDLAARNCMMDSKHVIKVADFGLTEEIYYGKNCNHHDQAGALLALKWMAPESSAQGDFSEKSDVWSFGITCWEVFSGGKTPYPAITPLSLLSCLQEGLRLEKPLNAACSDEMFQIMKKCWETEPKDRHTFSELITSIKAHADNTVASTQQTNAERESTKAEAKAATDVFLQNFPQLLEMVNPQRLAAVFFAKKIISDEVLMEFYNSASKNQGDQTLKLLHDVLKVIGRDPDCFNHVCTALEHDHTSIAKKMRDQFKELTKDKANGETSSSAQTEN